MVGRLTVAILSTAAAALLLLWASAGTRSPLNPPDVRVSLAVKRGLAFIEGVASDGKSFEENGFDLLWCFCSISQTSADPELRDLTWRFGHERALRWRADHSRVPPGAGADEVYQLVAGSHAAECLGVPDESLRRGLEQAALRITPEEMFRFDPRKEPPPSDIPKVCRKCGTRSARGSLTCRQCGAELELRDRYGVWCDAIIASYSAEVYGLRFGASLADVLQWLPRMHPYPPPGRASRILYEHTAYAVTHFVYAMNGYGLYRLRSEWFPREYEYLRTHIRNAISGRDTELLGEYMDTLKSFGLTEADPDLAAGTRYLLAHQNPDGSWGDPADPEIYDRYHTTWTAIDGLRSYAWRGERVMFPEAMVRLQP
ncbi:hypothetical protein [Paludibaculum fermentans]|uniref:Squalene cyclase C-terminal domain-containing protein n=1 Tax=Paludibaculum fermentans TaxID=1473598 RepID=A0A7S7NWQ8_PALFE|nr:hypothetical protein [Paludibaculum fermentans]QOY91198.1 hypothetical protein IRI77_14995 [Paludibaculum fermentans]